MLRAPYGDKGRIVRVSPDGAVRVLTTGFDSAADPEVSFDGRKILFAAKRSAGDRWHIYEMQADGSGTRQITSGPGDDRSPAYQPAYFVLDGTPFHQLTYVSSAGGGLNEYGREPATDLYSVNLDGSDARRLTYNLSSSFDPQQLPDGRVLFSSWLRHSLDRGLRGRVGLFGIHIDGADYAAFSYDEGRRIKHMPCVTAKGLVVFVESDRLPWDGAGTLGSVSLRRNLHSWRPLTTDKDGLFHSPSPLPDGSILVSRRPAAGGGAHAVYRLDPSSGRYERLFDDPGYHDIQAKVLLPRPEPDGHASVVDEKEPTAAFYCLSVYTSDVSLPAGSARTLRVVEGLQKRPEDASRDLSPLAPARILGQVELDEDGSFQIRTPANTPVQMQLLDASGVALRSSAWIWNRNKEHRGCIGCHEDGERTPENLLAKALTHPPAQLTLPPERRRTVDFTRDVLPILAARCATRACHGGAVEPRLDGGSKAGLEKFVHPGKARTSPLAWALFGKSLARPWDRVPPPPAPVRPMPPKGSPPLSDEERRTIVEWIDLGAHWR